jgi:shikimate kinase
MESSENLFSYPRIIFFIGFMGCGKTRLGKKMANKFNLPFIDLDTLIEEQSEQTIPEIFAQYGETGFREIEKQTLQNTAFPLNAIISTGGGAPCFYDNINWMNAHGLTIFLDTPIPILASRLMNAKTERPLIVGKTHEELMGFITTKLQERRPFYQQAKIVLTQADVTPEMVVEAIDSPPLEGCS